MNIRKFVVRAERLDDLVGLGTITPHAAAFLDAAVQAGLNVLVSGEPRRARRRCSTVWPLPSPAASASSPARSGQDPSSGRASLAGQAGKSVPGVGQESGQGCGVTVGVCATSEWSK